jgi:ABA responsive element binding factor
MGSATGAVQDGGASGGYLQRQASLILPRTLSQKTVDEVWKDMSKEFAAAGKDGSAIGGSIMAQSQRQQTLGEITLEEFLVRVRGSICWMRRLLKRENWKNWNPRKM